MLRVEGLERRLQLLVRSRREPTITHDTQLAANQIPLGGGLSSLKSCFVGSDPKVDGDHDGLRLKLCKSTLKEGC